MKKIVYILIIALLVSLVGSIIRCRSLSSDLQNYEHNLSVSRDSIRILTLKNGEQLVTIGSYILEKKDLQNYLDISKSAIKELEKKLVGRTIRIIEMKGEPKYEGKEGVIKSIDDAGQLHGTWGGLAIDYNEDVIEVFEN